MNRKSSLFIVPVLMSAAAFWLGRQFPAPNRDTNPHVADLPSVVSTNEVELISDVGAKTGVVVTDACPTTHDSPGSPNCKAPAIHEIANPFFPQPPGTKPKWTLQQWGSRSSLPTATNAEYGDGRVWRNEDKHFAIFPSGIFEMGVDGKAEFGGVYRQLTKRSAWPSFYFGFNITNPGNLQAGSGPITGMKALKFDFDAYLANANPNRADGYDASKNSVIFVLYFTVQNLNQRSEGFGQYVWLGVPVYNDIEESPGQYINSDDFGDGLGTHMLIYSVPYAKFSSVSMWKTQWTHLSRDLLPDVRESFALAVKRKFLKDPNPDNYYVSGVIIGFEVTGLNAVSMQFKTPSLQVSK